jgi:histidine decarboxylase
MPVSDSQWVNPTQRLVNLRRRLSSEAGLPRPIGFPPSTDTRFPSLAVDIGFGSLADLDGVLINNLGDPWREGHEPRNSKEIERDVVTQFVGLFGGELDECWGYVTTGGTEGNQQGLWLAREHFPTGVLYLSDAAHYSVPKAAQQLRMSEDSVVIATDDRGEMNYGELTRAAAQHAGRPAIVVATVGTTMTEAVDDVGRIHDALDDARVGVRDRHIHVDGALSAVPLALDGGPIARLLSAPAHGAIRYDADSASISGHKFFGTPRPSGVALTRREHMDRVARAVDYIDGVDATFTGSRSGHSAVELWYALISIGVDGHRHRVAQSRALAAYLQERLVAEGWTSWRHPWAFTVVLEDAPPAIVDRWKLATSGSQSHIICVPGLFRADIDYFVYELGPRTDAAGDRQQAPAVGLLRAATA